VPRITSAQVIGQVVVREPEQVGAQMGAQMAAQMGAQLAALGRAGGELQLS